MRITTPRVRAAPPPAAGRTTRPDLRPSALAVVVIVSLALAGMSTSPAAAAPAPGAGTGDDAAPQVRAGPGAAIPPVTGAIVRGFDPPDGPYGPGHRGVDLAAAPGEVVVSALPGTVRFSGEVAGTGWVTIDHGGSLTTTYGPLSGRVGQGQAVGRGQAIGRLTTGSHLDWGARDRDDYLDPLLLLQRWQLRLTAPDRVSS